VESKNRYVVEYFSEGADEMSTAFVEASSVAEAKSYVVERTSAFANIVACNLTKSCGGPGAMFQPEVPVQLADTELPETPAESVKSVKKVKPAKPVPVTKAKKENTPKVTNASRIREQIQLVKSTSTDEEADKQAIVTWAIVNLGQSLGTAKAYVKVIWAE